MENKIINPLTGKLTPIADVLHRLAAQENCDGEPYDQMQQAGDYIKELEKRLEQAEGRIKQASYSKSNEL